MEDLYIDPKMDQILRESREQLHNIALAIYNQKQKAEVGRRLAAGLLVNDILNNMRSTQLGHPRGSSNR